MNEFIDYVKHGWKLCRIEPGTKGPRYNGWNDPRNAVSAPAAAEKLAGAGLCHSYSGTCAIDVDRYDDAQKFLQEHGIDLNVLFSAPDAVQISSGRKNRGKLIYKLDAPLFTIKPANGALEFRSQARTGNTVQDVLPPTVHPDTGQPYKWVGDWKQLPTLPESLKKLWLLLLSSESIRNENPIRNDNAQLSELRDLLSRRDPNCGYEEWIKVGMALHHETEGNEDGLTLWDDWSAPSDKYPGFESLRSHWVSFGRSSTPITADSLRKTDTASVDQFEDLTAETGTDWFDAAPAETTKPKTSLEWIELSSFFSEPPPTWRIPGVLPDGEIGFIWGQKSAGKTFVAVDLAMRVALGIPWRGIPVKQGNILYFAAEDRSGVGLRLRAALAAYGATEAPIRVLRGRPNLTSAEDRKTLYESTRSVGKAGLIFIDTFAAAIPGADENSGKDVGPLLHYGKQLSAMTGAQVLFIHHEGKSAGRGMRGWSGLGGAADTEWEVTDQESHREMRIEKVKNAPSGNAYNFRLLPVGDSCIVEWI